MVTVEEIMSDPRFRINTQEPLRLFKEKISKYEIVKIKLGDLFCYYGEGLLKLEETAIYKFLDASVDGRCLYENYCKCHPTNFRNTANYEQLIKNLDTLEYDIKKGAIVINQHDIIIDGQHRSSILLKKYGPNYLVDVVKIHYSKHLIGLKWLKIKRLIMGGG